LLEYAKRIAAASRAEDILSITCREVASSSGAARVYASYCPPGRSWLQATHLEGDRDATRAVSPAPRSALFAIHRRLATRCAFVALRRCDETMTIFRALDPDDAVDEIVAVPIVHRTGRLWGQIVVPGLSADAPAADEAIELGRYATVALESVQRLAFARRDQDRLLLLAEATDDALYDWDLDARQFWWGGGIRALIASDADPVENTAQWKLARIHPEDRDRVQASYDAALASKHAAWKQEYRFLRHDGTYCHVEDRGYFLRDAAGRAYRLIGSMRDITAMKELLSREQQARADAESASRAKDEFLAMLGHELRNPLAPIVTGLEILRIQGAPRESKQLAILQRQAQHLIRLVDDLLDISRITHGKIELRVERLELPAVIAAAIETARPLIDGRRHHLDVQIAADDLALDGDHARLAQVIANLLTNAAKYTEPGGRITLIAERVGDDVVIVVRDTGVGIDPEMLPRVFHMFVQERQTLERSQGGLGLGLAIVRSLVELHGGTVAARSEGRGRGSELTIRLPAARPMPASVTTQPTAAETAPRPRGRRIMVVDDNEDAAEMLAEMLEHLGNTTRVANDADAAMRLVEEFAPDLAVLDIGLPIVDGYELARRLRARRGSDSLRLIALTGYGGASDRQRAASAGFDAHLVKPVGIGVLESVIDRLVGAP
jgi:PAS domain S-box-containing protein